MNALPTGAAPLQFDDVVPKDTSTRHVAAAAFYHCLGKSFSSVLRPDFMLGTELRPVLSTKDLIGIQQSKPYSMLRLTVK